MRRRPEAFQHPVQYLIARLRQYLSDRGSWGKADEEALITECEAEVEEAAEAYLITPPQSAESMFDHLFAELPATLGEQRSALLKEAAGQEAGDD